MNKRFFDRFFGVNIRIAIVSVIGVLQLHAQTWQSAIVHPDSTGKLVYITDTAGNRVPDFSYAGYRNGSVPIPAIAVVDSVSPVAGDNTANIQSAINRMSLRIPDADGFRGAILMKAGKYNVGGTILLNVSGVVLRGAGEGSDTLTNTVITTTGDSISQPTVLIAGGGNTGSNGSAWAGVLTSNINILDDSVKVGGRSFTVADPAPFAVGDNIVIVHPRTMAWLRAVNFGDVPNDTGAASYWASQNIPILYNRFITAINGSTITIDAPVFNTLVRSLSQCYIYKTNRSGILTHIGIENLRIDIINPYNESPAVNGDERHHSQDAIWLGKIEDAWVRHCTTLHFVQSGFKTSIATRVTIDSCSAIDPISIITGERRYNFNTYVASQLILFSNNYAKYARHAFISNGTSTVSGIVIYNCSSEESFNASEGHRLWSQGMLFDNFRDFNTNVSSGNYVLGLYNRGDMGSGHGWAAVHSVAWNCNVGTRRIVIQKPPTAQNYAVGCTGGVSGSGPFPHPAGYIEGSNTAGITPSSLYLAQINERLGLRPSAGSGNWSSPDTWNGAIPTAGDDVIIPAGDTITIDIPDAQCNNLRIDGMLVFPTSGSSCGITINGACIIDTGGVFRVSPQPVNSTALVHNLILKGNLTNSGGILDFRAGSGTNVSSNTICAVNLVMTGNQNSIAKVGANSSSNNEFNAITFSKVEPGRVILQSNMVTNTSSTVAGAFLTFTSGLVETGNDTLICLATSSSSVSGGSNASYVIGNLGRSRSSSAGTTFFPVGDSSGYRPLSLTVTTAGLTTRHVFTARVVHAPSNTGSSALSGGINAVSGVRYYSITYTQGASTSPSITLAKFAPSYGADDSVTAGLTNLRVAISSDYRRTWIAHGPANHTVTLVSPPVTINSDSLSGADQVTLTDGQSMQVCVAYTTPPVPAAPELVSPPDQDSSSSGTVQFLWRTSNAADIYSFEHAYDSAFTVLFVDSMITDTSKIISGIPAGSTLWWRVRARNGGGWGPYSEVRNVRVDYTGTVQYQSRWNMISLPVSVQDSTVAALFPDAISRAFVYRQVGGYLPKDTLTCGTGYWLKFPSAFSRTFHGFPLVLDTIPITTGWNMVGSISTILPVSAVGASVPGMIVSQFFRYNGSGYQPTDTVTPGYAYWVKSLSDGALYFGGAENRKSRLRPVIRIMADMPPANPDEFSSIPHSLPSVTCLEQNYPNPFNPFTVFQYAIGRADGTVPVTLKIYDIIGKEVAILVNEVQSPGYYTALWNVSRTGTCSSGIYYCRLIAGTFSETRKILLVK